MTNSLGDIIKQRRSGEPPEIATIKAYVQRRFKAEVRVSVSKTSVTIWAPNATLAGSLRLNQMELLNSLKTSKRLIIRIGQQPI